MRLARISSGGVRSRSAFFGTARDNRLGTRDFYNGVVACAMRCAGSSIGCNRHATPVPLQYEIENLQATRLPLQAGGQLRRKRAERINRRR